MLIADPYDRGAIMGSGTGNTGPITLATLVASGTSPLPRSYLRRSRPRPQPLHPSRGCARSRSRCVMRLRIPFTHFTGRSVYHGHILDHEDAGIMATVVAA